MNIYYSMVYCSKDKFIDDVINISKHFKPPPEDLDKLFNLIFYEFKWQFSIHQLILDFDDYKIFINSGAELKKYFEDENLLKLLTN